MNGFKTINSCELDSVQGGMNLNEFATKKAAEAANKAGLTVEGGSSCPVGSFCWVAKHQHNNI